MRNKHIIYKNVGHPALAPLAKQIRFFFRLGPEGPHPGHYHANVVDLGILTTARQQIPCATKETNVQFPSIKRTPHSPDKTEEGDVFGSFYGTTKRSDYLNIGRFLLARIN